MVKIIALFCILGSFISTATALSAEGDLDVGFNTPFGFVTYDGPGQDYDDGFGVALQSDGKIVVAGDTWNGSDYDVLILRYNPDGTPDSTFGTGGAAVYSGAQGQDDYSYSVAVDPNGKILTAGYRWNGNDSDVLVLRYNPDGTPDSTFGTGGAAIYNSGAKKDDAGYAIVLQGDGKIVVSGDTWNGTASDVLVLRYNGNGTLDSSFGTGGVVTYDTGATHDEASYAMAIQGDGKIVVAGDTWNGTDFDVLVLRFDSNGALDSAFGSGGGVTYGSAANQDDFCYTVALQPDGKIIVGSDVLESARNTIHVLRYEANGMPDSTFGTEGVVDLSSLTDQGVYCFATTVQQDGKIVLAGDNWNSTDNDVLVMRLIGAQVNSPPTAVIDSISPNPATAGQGIAFSGSGMDPDGTIVEYEWTSSINGKIGSTASFSSSTLSTGTHTISFRVKDDDGAWSPVVTQTLTVSPVNSPPTAVIDSISPNPATAGQGITFSGSGMDSDGTIVEYEWTSSINGKIGSTASFSPRRFRLEPIRFHSGSKMMTEHGRLLLRRR